MVGCVGRLAGGWVGWWVAVGECIRACERWSCYFLRYEQQQYLVFCYLRYVTGLLWRSSSTTQRIRLVLYCCSMVGALVGWWMAWSVGGCVVRYVGDSLSANWMRICRVGAVVVLCVASFPCCRTLMLYSGFVLFKNQVELKSAS